MILQWQRHEETSIESVMTRMGTDLQSISPTIGIENGIRVDPEIPKGVDTNEDMADVCLKAS